MRVPVCQLWIGGLNKSCVIFLNCVYMELDKDWAGRDGHSISIARDLKDTLRLNISSSTKTGLNVELQFYHMAW